MFKLWHLKILHSMALKSYRVEYPTYLFDICHQNSLGYIDKLVFHLWLDIFHDYNDSVPIHMDYGSHADCIVAHWKK